MRSAGSVVDIRSMAMFQGDINFGCIVVDGDRPANQLVGISSSI